MNYKTFIFDLEVMKYYNLAVFKEYHKDNWYIFENDTVGLMKFIDQHRDDLLCGFNNKHYDNWVLLTMYNQGNNFKIKEHNDWIFEGKQPWNFPFNAYKKRPFMGMDLRDDLPRNLSLKEIEANLYMDIKETEVDFNIDRPLTDEEKHLMRKYCKWDVLATERLYDERLSYINCKKVIAKIGNMDERFCLTKTNAQLTALFLGAKKVSRSIEDIRSYVIPDCINLKRIPKEVLDFFDNLKDESIPMEHILDTDKKDETNTLKHRIGNCNCVIALGGIHGANGNENINNDEKLILNYDVALALTVQVKSIELYQRCRQKCLLTVNPSNYRVIPC